jgi:ABC-type nitrate/sulfonate/bicarbonate transport system substrate-binding protein
MHLIKGKITRVNRFFIDALVMLLLFLLSAGRAEPAELRKLTLGYSTVGPAGTGLWMAKEIGAFDKYGIDAELIFVSSGPIVVRRCWVEI